ncbi:MAG TPA: transporter substrate-binding domain-containing protein [Negativicutes bacterium]|jgi:ABC-type amino acid transport substrate-binding protein
MKKYQKIIVGFISLMLAAILVAGCGQSAAGTQSTAQNHVEQIKKKGKFVVATSAYRPLQFHDQETNKLIGLNIDLAEAVAKKLGVPLEVIEIPFPSLIPTLQNEQADIVIATMYITDQRKEVVDFTDPYMDTGVILVVKTENNNIKSIDDINGKVIGVKAGAETERVAQNLKTKGYDFTIKSYKETEDYLLDLENGRLDAAINDILFQLAYNKDRPGLKLVGDPFTKVSVAMAARKGDKELVDVANTVIREMKQSGQSEKLYQKWVTGK